MIGKKKEIEKKKPVASKLVKMIKDGVKSDVHPDEVSNWLLAGHSKV